MTSALVGYSGFVGGNLAAQWTFDDFYNSANVGDIAGTSHGTVVFSAAKAEKWRINQDPESDLRHIEELEGILASFTTERLVLISTVDVFGDPREVDESTVIDTDGLHPYGAHRLRLESAARSLHPNVTVVRLPGLFGPGIKKNVIFDLLNDNNVDRISPDGVFQYYDLRRLGADLRSVVDTGMPLVHLVTEPVSTGEIARVVFGTDLPAIDVPAGRYDVRTLYAAELADGGRYLRSRDEVLADLRSFVAEYPTR